MAHFLMAAHPTVGHTQALRAVGKQLQLRQHTLSFATLRIPSPPSWLPFPAGMRAGGGLGAQFERDGFEFVGLPASLRSAYAAYRVGKTRGYDELGWAMDLFTGDALALARRLLAIIEAQRPAAVIADCFFYGAWLAAERAKLPFVAVFHSGLPFPVPGEPPFGSGLTPASPRESWQPSEARLSALARRVDERTGAARRALGLPGVAPRLLERPYARGLNVLTTFPEFELPRPGLEQAADGPVLWVGPCLGERTREAEGNFPWERLAGDQPLVYISLGTVFNSQPRVYATLLEGVHRAGARAIVAAGAALKAVQSKASAQDVVVAFAPQVALLERVDAVIGHGGNNSTNETLRAGKPLLVVPFGAEQIGNGQRVARLGVGQWLSPASLTVPRVAESLGELLAPQLRSAARSLSASAPRADGTRVFADAVESLVSAA